MSFKIAEGYVEVTADGSRAISEAVGIGQSIGGRINSGIGTIFGGNLLASLAHDAGAAIGQGIRTGIDYGVEAISLASDLNESFNAVEVTFGSKVAADLQVLAEAAPRTLRVTQVAFNEYATRFSAFADKIVGPGGDVVGFMDELTQRGADFSSVYNIEVADALQLFQSGLAGESEPLRRYGIDLSEATVQTYAWTHGIAENGVQLTESEKIQARYGSLLEQTAKTQGDAANTGGELAAQQRLLAVGWQEAQTSLGTYLLPGFNALVTTANEQLLPALGNVIENVGPILGQALSDNAPKFEEMLGKLEPLVTKLVEGGTEALPGLIDGFGEFADAVPEWLDAFSTIDGGVRDLDKGFHDFQDTLIQSRADRIEWFQTWIDDVNDWSKPVNDAVNTFLEEVFTTPTKKLPGQAHDAGVDTARGLGRGIRDGQSEAVQAAADLAEAVIYRAKNVLGVASPSKEFFDIGDFATQGLVGGLDEGGANVDAAVRRLLPTKEKMTATVGGGFPSGMLGGSGGGTTIMVAAGAVVLDAKNVKDFEDVVRVFEEIGQEARKGRGPGSGEGR